MCESYCGQDCNKCEKREEFQCSGCKQGPGKYNPSKCDLANCCQNKGHESCKTCTLSNSCHMLHRRGYVVEAMLARQKAEAQCDLQEGEKSKFLGKCFTALFVVMVFAIVNSILSGVMPVLEVPTTIIDAIRWIANAVILLIMSRYSDHYKSSAICLLIAELGEIVLWFFIGDETPAWSLLISIPLAIMGIYSVFQTCQGHSEVLCSTNSTLSSKWNRMYCFKMYVLIATIVCTLLVFIPVLNVIAALGLVVVAIAGVIVGVLEIVYLYQSMKHFRDYSMKYNAETVDSK